MGSSRPLWTPERRGYGGREVRESSWCIAGFTRCCLRTVFLEVLIIVFRGGSESSNRIFANQGARIGSVTTSVYVGEVTPLREATGSIYTVSVVAARIVRHQVCTSTEDLPSALRTTRTSSM